MFLHHLRSPKYLSYEAASQDRTSKSAMASNDERVIRAVFKQLEVTTLNYEQLRQELEVDTTNAAKKRWYRCRDNLFGESGFSSALTPNDDRVLRAVFKQLSIKPLDYKQLASDLEVNTVNAAKKRWYRTRDNFFSNNTAQAAEGGALMENEERVAKIVANESPKRKLPSKKRFLQGDNGQDTEAESWDKLVEQDSEEYGDF